MKRLTTWWLDLRFAIAYHVAICIVPRQMLLLMCVTRSKPGMSITRVNWRHFNPPLALDALGTISGHIIGMAAEKQTEIYDLLCRQVRDTMEQTGTEAKGETLN